MTSNRCTEHPAFEADYCPSCGTARVIGAAYPGPHDPANCRCVHCTIDRVTGGK